MNPEIRLFESSTQSELDPNDWDEFARLAHDALDDALEYLRTVRTRRPWSPVPASVKEALSEPLPLAGQPIRAVYETFKKHILPYPTGNIHPRFWGWVMGTGSPVGVIAEMLAATMNCHVAGYDQSAVLVEDTTLSWLKQLIRYPSGASGLLVSGGTAANLIGLTVARHAADSKIRAHGINGSRMTVYASSETHSWAKRSCELLGLGQENLRLIPVNDAFQIDCLKLSNRVKEDRRDGFRPFCVIGNAGTVNTGAVDDLKTLAKFCQSENLWLHIDGAFGALAAISDRLWPLVQGIEEAHSIAFDLHKWGYVPYEIGCVLVRDGQIHKDTFATTPHYLAALPGGIAREPLVFADLGIQLSRGFRALKLWMALKCQGSDAWRRSIEKNYDQAQRLVRLILLQPELELLSPAPLNVVNFRYRGLGSDSELDVINQQILVRLQSEGIAVPSSTVLNGRFSIRVAHTNHRSTDADFDALLDATLAFGRDLSK